jgi:hypothetical protein
LSSGASERRHGLHGHDVVHVRLRPAQHADGQRSLRRRRVDLGLVALREPELSDRPVLPSKTAPPSCHDDGGRDEKEKSA